MEQTIDISRLPNTPGVYIMRDSAARIIYIGKAKALRKRVASYFKNSPDMKTVGIISSLRHIDFVLCASERDALVLERQLINKLKPYYNSMWKDDKSYPYLKLTLKEDFPRLFVTRKKIKDGSEYFGPYTAVFQTHSLLRWMQKVFRWRICKMELFADKLPPAHKIKSCLYMHTGRCPAPCNGSISPEEYKKNILRARLFLKGKYDNLIKLWKKDMRAASNSQQYELAAELRNRITALESMGERVTYKEVQPEDLTASLKTTSALEELKADLNLPQLPVIIECFDISNISGTDSVGSMVRFQNGKPDKSGYRKFKIRSVIGIDDTAMIKEVVFRRYRRLKNSGLQMPNLVVIDGGPGQLNSAKQSLDMLKLKLPLVSLAKQNEEIYFPDKQEPLVLPKDSQALHILQAARDEAHRFAVAFHHLRRKKRMQTQG